MEPSPLQLNPAAVCVSVVVPTYREAENLPELFQRVREAMVAAGISYDIIVVDDNSRDGTEAAAKAAVEAGHPVTLIVRTTERGLSSAVIAGFRAAQGEFIACMDADLSHPPEKLPELVDELRANRAEFVIGSRYVKGAGTDETWGLFRWLNSKVATLLARPFTKVKDPMSGFFALSRQRFAGATALNPVGYKIGLELLVKCGCRRVAEIPIHFADRKRGQSKLSLREQLNYVRHLKRLADYQFGWFSKFVQFCAVGGTGVVVDLSTYAGLLAAALPVPPARALAIWVAMTWNFWLNRHITFSHSRHRHLGGQYLAFTASCSIGAAVNWAVSMGLLHTAWFDGHRLSAALAGIIAGTGVNFYISFHHVFKHK